ncbi:MAG: gas vesicle protein [Planctomycetes bacterium]|nr:gas vesicle protein [Planctomycetota bacterium]
MKPTRSLRSVQARDRKATLVDLLDRVLEKGVVISADIVITLAGIPLIGINLRAAVAGMETMLKYGMMKEWDIRTCDLPSRKKVMGIPK